MTTTAIVEALNRVAVLPGIGGCALVDAGTGMVWHANSDSRISEQVWEAAIDYWNLHKRQNHHFKELGPLRATVMYHTDAVLAVIPCSMDPELLFVARGDHRGVDWRAVQAMVRELGKGLRKPTGSARPAR